MNRPGRYTYIGKSGKKINLGALAGGGASGIGGLSGGYSTDAIQPDDESTLEQGTSQNSPLGSTTTFNPYTVNHPILDALFNQGRGALTAQAYNNSAGATALAHQNALDELDYQNQIQKNNASDEDFNRGAMQSILDVDDFDKQHNIDSTPLDMSTLGKMLSYKYGNNLPTQGSGVASNIYDKAVAEKPYIPDEVGSGAKSVIASNNTNTQAGVNRLALLTAQNPYIPATAKMDFNTSQAQGNAAISKANYDTQTTDDLSQFNRNFNGMINADRVGKLGLSLANNDADTAGANNRLATFTAQQPYIQPRVKMDFDTASAKAGEDVSKSALNQNNNEADLAFNKQNQGKLNQGKLDQLSMQQLNLDRMKKIIASEKMQTIPVDENHHIMYDPETKDAVLIGTEFNKDDAMHPIITTKHWSMEYNGEVLPNGMIKKADGTLINPKVIKKTAAQ